MTLDCSPDSPVQGISLARILEYVAFPPSGYLAKPRIETEPPVSPALQEDSLLTEPSGNIPF